MELVHGGVKFLVCAWLWFCLTCVWMLLAPGDRVKLWRSRIKEDNLQKLSTLFALYVFCSSSLETLGWFFYYGWIERKNAQDAKF